MRNLSSIFFFIMLCSVSACFAYKDTLLIVNKSQEPIVSITIEVCGKKLEARDIQPGGVVELSYEIRGDCSYKMCAHFQSGRKVEKETGYVTSGFSYEHEIAITDSDISLLSTRLKKGQKFYQSSVEGTQ